MMLGSVEDETIFNALGFIKSNIRNKLDKNLETCLRMYNSRYDVHNFPYDRAVKIWRKKCQRRGMGNISNQSGVGSANKNATGTNSCIGVGSVVEVDRLVALLMSLRCRLKVKITQGLMKESMS